MAIKEDFYLEILTSLDGTKSFNKIVSDYKLNQKEVRGLNLFFELLIERCVLEDLDIVSNRINHPFRRVVNFIGSYIPYHAVTAAYENITNSHAVIIGAGGVGSWVVMQLAQMGIKNFTIIDDDVVKPHNLNRSIFSLSQLNQYKASSIKEQLKTKKKGYYSVVPILEKVDSAKRLLTHLENLPATSVLINCADYPSVAQTSAIIHDAAFEKNIPYMIAGGYNMHLSLVGPTIIPHRSPCFHCISHGMDQLHIAEIDQAERVVKQHRNLGNLAPLAAISASFISNECLKLLLDCPKVPPTMLGKRGEFNFFTKKLSLEEYDYWEECSFCTPKELRIG